MHACLAPEHLDDGPEFAADTVCRALAIENPHSSKVMGKMPRANRVRRHFLIEVGGPDGNQPRESPRSDSQ
jgi:hypothetical protein